MKRARAGLALLLLLAALVGCRDEPGTPAAAPSATASLFTLTPVPLPPAAPPSGRLVADIEQSSRDGAAHRFQVWIDNDTDTDITPTAVTYDDPRLHAPLPGARLREIPSQARRGFPLDEPDRPVCGAPDTGGSDAGGSDTGGSDTGGSVTVEYTAAGRAHSVTVPVSDEAEVVERVTSARCLELGVAKIAHLSFAEEVTADGDGGRGSVGTMTLRIETTGRPGPTLVIDSVVGNPVLSPGDLGVYEANLTITGDQPAREVPIPIRPTRCDAHAFGESGSFAAFAFNVHLDGRPGQFVLRLGPTAAVNALAYAKASCGFLTSIDGGQG